MIHRKLPGVSHIYFKPATKISSMTNFQTSAIEVKYGGCEKFYPQGNRTLNRAGRPRFRYK